MRGPLALLLTALLAAGPVLSVSASPLPETDWFVEDPANDLSPLLPDTPGVLPSGPLFSSADLRKVQIDSEDDLGLFLTLVVDGLEYKPDVLCCAAYVTFDVDFSLTSGTISYQLYVSLYGALDTDPSGLFVVSFIYADLCLSGDDGCYWQPVNVTLDDEANAVRVWIPKDSLMGKDDDQDRFQFLNEAPKGTPRILRAGDQLTDLKVTSATQLLLVWPARFFDSAPDSGVAPPYVLKTGSANSIISLELGDEFLSVEAGQNQSIPFVVHNGAAGKRIVNLAYQLKGPDDKVGLYGVQGPPAVTIAGGESRTFSLSLLAKPEASKIDGVRLSVRGVSVGYSDEIAFDAALLEPTIALGPTSNILYLHGERQDYYETGTPVDTVRCQSPLTVCSTGFLSPLQQDPDATSDRIEGYWYPNEQFTNQRFNLWMSESVPLPLLFDPSQPIQLDLKLQAPVNVEGVTVRAEVSSWDEAQENAETIFEAEQSGFPVSTGGTLITLTSPLRLSGKPLLPMGTSLQLNLIVGADSPTGAAGWAAGGFQIMADESQLHLPLLPLPDDVARSPLTSSPFQLSAVDDRELFVNPGEARLFNVTILNQGPETERVELGTNVSLESWRAGLIPGSSFQLAAGDTVTVGVLVHAPKDAKEGERATIRLNAASFNREAATLTLSLIATQLDQPDDSNATAPDQEAGQKLVKAKPKNGIPGFESGLAELAALAAAGLLAVWDRRRKA